MKYTGLLILMAVGILLTCCIYQPLQAQTNPVFANCGTGKLTPAQKLSLVQQANRALQRKRLTQKALTATTYIPIRPHIVRRGDGTGGLDMAGLNQMMALTNSHYLLNGYGIQFYFAGSTPDYIDSDQLYDSFPYSEGSVIDGRDATNAMNQYYVYQFSTFISGYAYYPFNSIVSTRSFIATGDGSQPIILGNQVIPHELGHNFNLYHTFGDTNGGSRTDELVTRGAGANCSLAGDLLCDTPADPYTPDQSNTIYVNGCTQYDSTSTVRDANGDRYMPLVNNIMSYYYGACTHDFTADQHDRMQAALAFRQSHTAYTLDAPATSVNPVTNLVAIANSYFIRLTWQDNATNEMGYFIERSSLPNEGFVPVSGVSPNVTTFTDEQVTPGNQYYYRIRPSNTTTGSLGPTVAVSTSSAPCLMPMSPLASAGRISVLFSWTGDAGQTYTLRWRTHGAHQWNLVTNLSTNVYSLTGLTSNTAYDWQVQGICSESVSSAFTTEQLFWTHGCLEPYFTACSDVGSSSALLSWTVSDTEPNRTFEVRYRPLGTEDWTTRSGILTTTYSLTGLTSMTMYEWQVKSICSPTESSEFNDSSFFQTLTPCLDMYTLRSGVWDDPTVWSCGRVPMSTDAVQIKHAVMIPAGYVARVKQIKYDGGQQLIIGTGSMLQFGQ